jgi:hypothetical protein
MKARSARIIALTSLIGAMTPGVWSQVNRGTIRGTVLDPSEAVIAHAKVTAVNVDSGVPQSTVTTGLGNYSIQNLPGGVYRVEAEAPGFKKLVRENVLVEIGAIAGLDLQLELGAAAETIRVSAEAPQLRNETSDVSTSVKNEIFMNMPLAMGTGRNPTSFAGLVTPGAVAQAGPNGGGYAPTSFSGSQIISGEVLLDGLSVTFAPQPGTSDAVGGIAPEAIQEASVTTGAASAEFGTGGTVTQQYTIRSGTSNFHGNAYEYFRNTDLDARAWFAKFRPPEHRNEYGGSLGGPIAIPHLFKSNRSFFFVNVQGFKFRQTPSSSLITVPTAAFKQGDFSGLVNGAGQQIPIYDPQSTVCDTSGNCTRTPFVGNLIPSTRFSQVAKNILPYLPDPNSSGIVNNFIGVAPSPQNRNSLTFKIDQRITDKQSFVFSYSMFTNQVYNGSVFGDPTGVLATNYLPVSYRTPRFSYDWVATPNVVVHAAVGYNRHNRLSYWEGSDKDWNQVMGIKGLWQGPCSTAGFSWSGPISYQQIGRGTGTPAEIDITNKYLYNASISVIKGRNNLKFGFDANTEAENFANPQGCGGFGFSNNETAFPTNAMRPVTGDAFASFLLGQVDSAGGNIINGVTGTPRWKRFAGYAQDDIKLKRNLTLNLGIRYDYWTPVYDKFNNLSLMDPNLANPAAGGTFGAMIFAGTGPGRFGTSDLTSLLGGGNHYNYFSPHLGFAYSAMPNLVVRSGFGINYFGGYLYGTGNWRAMNGGFTSSGGIGSPNLGVSPALLLDNGFPAGLIPQPPFINPAYGVGQGVSTVYSNATALAYVANWSFDVQYTPAKSWLVDVGYVGNAGNNLTDSLITPNQVNPSYLSLGNLLNQPINSPSVTAAGFTLPYAGFIQSFPNTPTLAQALRPFPQYSGVNLGPNNGPGQSGSANNGHSTYHALQWKVQKRLSEGLFLLTAFTWAKKITNADSSWGNGNQSIMTSLARDTYNQGLEKALAPSDVSDRFTGVFIYELPFGPGRKFVHSGGPIVRKALQGWQLEGTLTYQAGLPISVNAPNTLPLFNNFNMPNMVLGINPCQASSSGFNPQTMLGLNSAAFSAPPLFTFGNAPAQLGCRSFALESENLGLMKRTTITEKASLEFRFEAFDAFNRHQFSAPNGNYQTPAFGTVAGTSNGPRSAQLAMRLNF